MFRISYAMVLTAMMMSVGCFGGSESDPRVDDLVKQTDLIKNEMNLEKTKLEQVQLKNALLEEENRKMRILLEKEERLRASKKDEIDREAAAGVLEAEETHRIEELRIKRLADLDKLTREIGLLDSEIAAAQRSSDVATKAKIPELQKKHSEKNGELAVAKSKLDSDLKAEEAKKNAAVKRASLGIK